MAARDSLQTRINADGFRRWYEYELTRAFGYLGLGVLLLVAGMASLEGIFDSPPGWVRLPQYLTTFFCLCGAGWAWMRFVGILFFAENLSQQAVCPQCQRYGAIVVTDERSTPDGVQRLLTANCKKCEHAWQLSFDLESGHAHRKKKLGRTP